MWLILYLLVLGWPKVGDVNKCYATKVSRGCIVVCKNPGPLGNFGTFSLNFYLLGFPVQQDFISENLLGAQYAPVTVRPDSQTRDSSQTAFLDTSIRNGQINLKVYTHTLAKQPGLIWRQQYRYPSSSGKWKRPAIHLIRLLRSDCIYRRLPITTVAYGVWNWI
jgi:hypothetical protein